MRSKTMKRLGFFALLIAFLAPLAVQANVLERSIFISGSELGEIGAVAAGRGADKVKFIGRLEDLKDIPREQTLLDQLPNLGNPKANYYQNMSVL